MISYTACIPLHCNVLYESSWVQNSPSSLFGHQNDSFNYQWIWPSFSVLIRDFFQLYEMTENNEKCPSHFLRAKWDDFKLLRLSDWPQRWRAEKQQMFNRYFYYHFRSSNKKNDEWSIIVKYCHKLMFCWLTHWLLYELFQLYFIFLFKKNHHNEFMCLIYTSQYKT